MSNYQGSGSYVASGCLNEDGYNNKCHVANGRICDERF